MCRRISKHIGTLLVRLRTCATSASIPANFTIMPDVELIEIDNISKDMDPDGFQFPIASTTTTFTSAKLIHIHGAATLKMKSVPLLAVVQTQQRATINLYCCLKRETNSQYCVPVLLLICKTLLSVCQQSTGKRSVIKNMQP